jgi:predicted metal-dependent hydrolase
LTAPDLSPDLPGGLPLVVRIDARARRLTLRLCAQSRSIRLTLPPRASRRRAEAFLADQAPWLRAAAARLPPPTPFRPGTRLPFGDGELLLSVGPGRSVRLAGDMLEVPAEPALYARRVRRWLAAEAERRLAPETRALADRLGRPVTRVSTGDFTSRWGSCSRDGRIAYNWRLLFAPGTVREAVVAHEVAHLAEPHHGPAFWRLATELLGRPHTEARAWLKANAGRLHSYGAEA